MPKKLSPWGLAAKTALLQKGISLETLSNITGYSRTYISSIINGRVYAPEETIESISKKLDIDHRLYLMGQMYR